MDKAYTLMFKVNKAGLIVPISNLIDYSTEEGILEHFKLALPNKNKLINNIPLELIDWNKSRSITPDLINAITDKQYESLSTFDSEYLGWSKLEKLRFLIKFQDLLRSDYTWVCPMGENPYTFIEDSNAHNNYTPSVDGLKNKITANVIYAAKSLSNLWASEQPMEASPVNNVIAELDKISGEDKLVYDPINPYTKFMFLEFNSVGKDGVGIAANGVKVDGSIQQYFNNLYAGLDDSFYSDFLLSLSFNIPQTGEKYKKTFTRFANTKIDTQEQFIALFENISDEELLEFTEYRRWNDVLRNQRFNQIVSDLTWDNFIDKAKEFTNIDLRFAQEALLWYLEKGQNLAGNYNRGAFLDFLYYRIQFEANAADLLSIFISLATDNAKELKLYKINGTRELLSMGIAMVALGVDLKTALSVTKFLLDPVAKYINQSAFMNKNKNPYESVRDAIIAVAAKNSTIAENLESLLKINTLSGELTGLAGYYKLNLGVTARYEEALGFLQRLSKFKKDAEKTREKSLVKDNDQYNFYGQLIDVLRFVEDGNYRSALIDYMEQFKAAINILDVVTKSPQYYAFLEALTWNTSSFRKSCFLANVFDSNILLWFNPKDNIHRHDLLRAARHYIIGKALDKMHWLLFNTKDVYDVYGIKLSYANIDGIFNLKSGELIAQFVKLVENYVIPELKQNDATKSNYFIKELTKSFNYLTNRDEYIIDYNLMDEDPNVGLIIDDIKSSYMQIQQVPSKLKLVGVGRNLTIGEVFFLYNLIVHENSLGTLSKIVENTTSLLLSYLRQTCLEMDTKTRRGEDFTQLFMYFGSLAKAAKSRAKKTNLVIPGTTLTAIIDLSDSYIWTKGTYNISSEINIDDFFESMTLYDNIEFEDEKYQILPGGRIKIFIKNGLPLTISMSEYNISKIGNKYFISGVNSDSELNTAILRRNIIENLTSILQVLKTANQEATIFTNKSTLYNTITLNDALKELGVFDVKFDSKLDWRRRIIRLIMSHETNSGLSFAYVTTIKSQLFRPYIAKYAGNDSYLVLNKSSLDLIFNDDYEYSNLLDVLILNTFDKDIVSIEDRIKRFLEFIDFNNEGLAELYAENKKDFEHKFNRSSNKSLYYIYLNYLNYLYDIETLPVHDLCRLELNSYSEALKYADIFYSPVMLEFNEQNINKLIENRSLVPGDIISLNAQNAPMLLYLGVIDGKYYFASLNPETLKKYNRWIGSELLLYNKLYLKYRLTRSKADPIGDFTSTDFEYDTEVKDVKASNLRKGDKIFTRGREWIVLTATSVTNKDKREVEIILKNLSGNISKTIVASDKLFKVLKTKSESLKSSVIVSGKSVKIDNFAVLPIEFIETICNKIDSQSQLVDINGKKYTILHPARNIFGNLTGISCLDSDGLTLEILIEDIKSVIINKWNYSPGLKSLIVPLLYYLPQTKLIPQSGLGILKTTVDVLINGYISRLRYLYGYKNSYLDNKSFNKEQFNKFLLVDQNNTPVFATNGLNKVQNVQELRVGDFIFNKTSNSVSWSEIISETEDNFLIVTHTINYTNTPIPDKEILQYGGAGMRTTLFAPNTSIHTLNKLSVHGIEAYTNRNISNVSFVSEQSITNPEEKINAFLSRLAQKFNTSIITENSPHESWTAQVDENGIRINLAKRPEGESGIKFLLKEGVHELLHLVLAELRIMNPDLYFSLTETLNNLIEHDSITKELANKILSEMDNSAYEGYKRTEELLVRIIVNSALQDNKLENLIINGTSYALFELDFYQAVETAFYEVFNNRGVNLSKNVVAGNINTFTMLHTAIESFLDNYNNKKKSGLFGIFSPNEKHLNMSSLAQSAALDGLYSKITFKCL